MPRVGIRTRRLYLKELNAHFVAPLTAPSRFRAWNRVLDTDMLYFTRMPKELGRVTAGFGSRANSVIDVSAANRKTTIQIGKFVTIGKNLKILDTFAHNPNAISVMNPYGSFGRNTPEEEVPSTGPIVIGNDVGIGDDCTLLGGVTIGDGAGITASSFIAGDVPAYALFGGVPARPIRPRVAKEYADRLLELKWWDLPPDVIWENRRLLTTSDIAAALPQLEAIARKVRQPP